MDRSGESPGAGRGNVVARAPGPAGSARLTAGRLGEPAATYLQQVERRTIRLADIIARPHRAQLDRHRVANLQRIPKPHAVAVVYEPGTGYVLLGGEHRLAALVGRGDYEADVYVLRSWRDFVAWMMLDVQPGHGVGAAWTVVDAAYLAIKATGLLKPAREELPFHDLAEFCQVHEGAMANVRWLIQLAEDIDEPGAPIRDFAARELAAIHRGEAGPHGVRDRVKKERARLLAAATPPMPVAKQSALIGDIVARLAGITNGFDVLGELNPGLSPDDLTAWHAALGQANTKIIQLRTKIREKQQ